MILFALLLVTLIFVVIFSVLVISATGATFIVLFGDVIICGYLIVKVMKYLLGRKKRKD